MRPSVRSDEDEVSSGHDESWLDGTLSGDLYDGKRSQTYSVIFLVCPFGL